MTAIRRYLTPRAPNSRMVVGSLTCALLAAWAVRARAQVATEEKLEASVAHAVEPPAPARAVTRRGLAPHVFAGEISIALATGEAVAAGTCGVEGARHTGDTTLTLLDPDGVRVAFNDDACGGTGSRLEYTARLSGVHRLAMHCHGRSACGGHVAWEVSGTARRWTPPAAQVHERSGSAPLEPGRGIAVRVAEGHRLIASACGGVRHADTTLELFDPDGERIAFDDYSCGALGARLAVRARVSGVYRLVPDCRDAHCGRVEWRISEHPEPLPYVYRWTVQARALVGPAGAGLVADSMFEWRPSTRFSVRLEAAPVSLGGGEEGGLFGGGVQLSAGLDLGYAELGVGVGAAVLALRPGAVREREAVTLLTRARVGALSHFHVEAQFALALPGDADGQVNAIPAVDASARLPLGAVDLVARGGYGFQGVGLGEVAVVFWLDGAVRRSLGLSVHAGGAALLYQPVCRFGLTCDATIYAGPHVGLGLDVRP